MSQYKELKKLLDNIQVDEGMVGILGELLYTANETGIIETYCSDTRILVQIVSLAEKLKHSGVP